MARGQNVLRRTDVNELAQIIQSQGFDLSQFAKSQEVIGKQGVIGTVRFTHKEEVQYFFEIHVCMNDFRVIWSPDEYHIQADSQALNFKVVKAYFQTWLKALHTEIGARDLWAEGGPASQIVGALDSIEADDTAFTPEEQTSLLSALDELTNEAKQTRRFFGQILEKVECVERKLGCLRKAVGTQGRWTWLHTAIGVGVTLAVAFGPSIAAVVFRGFTEWLARNTLPTFPALGRLLEP